MNGKALYDEAHSMRFLTARSISRVLVLLLLCVVADVGRAEDDAPIVVPLSQDHRGIDPITRRCFTQLRAAGHGPDRVPASELGDCVRPEIEAMAEFAYEVATGYAVSPLTRVALETCTLEQTNALTESIREGAENAREKLSWRWLADCLVEVRWLDHEDQVARLGRARLEAEKSKEK